MVPGSGSAPGGGRTTSRNIAAPQPRGADLEALSCQWRLNSRAAYMSGCGVGCLASDAMGAIRSPPCLGRRRSPRSEVLCRCLTSAGQFAAGGEFSTVASPTGACTRSRIGRQPASGAVGAGDPRPQVIADTPTSPPVVRCRYASNSGRLSAPIAAETDGRRCRLALSGLMQSLDRNRAAVKLRNGSNEKIHLVLSEAHGT